MGCCDCLWRKSKPDLHAKHRHDRGAVSGTVYLGGGLLQRICSPGQKSAHEMWALCSCRLPDALRRMVARGRDGGSGHSDRRP